MKIEQLVRSLPLVNRLHHGLRLARRALLVRRLQLMRSLPLANRLHLGLRALLVRREKPLEVKNSLGCSELTEKSINFRIGAGPLREPAPFPFWRQHLAVAAIQS